MKLLFCKNCCDILLLLREWRWCKCRRTGGHYTKKGNEAEYKGPAVPLIIHNRSFRGAVKYQPARTIEEYDGATFESWVVPKENGNFRRVE